jgi:uncharacterized membrane protein
MLRSGSSRREREREKLTYNEQLNLMWESTSLETGFMIFHTKWRISYTRFYRQETPSSCEFQKNSVRLKHKVRSRKEKDNFQISHGNCCHSIFESGINCARMKMSRKALSHFSDGNWGISKNIFISLSLSLSLVSQFSLLLLDTITLILWQLSKCAMKKKIC